MTCSKPASRSARAWLMGGLLSDSGKMCQLWLVLLDKLNNSWCLFA